MKKRAPYAQTRNGIVHFGLNHKSLRLRHVIDWSKPCLIAGPGLVESRMGRLQFDRCVRGDLTRSVHHCLGFDKLLLQVRDNGPGMGARRESRAGSIGLVNTRERLTRLYGDRHLFELLDDDGLLARLTIPYAS